MIQGGWKFRFIQLQVLLCMSRNSRNASRFEIVGLETPINYQAILV